MKQEIKERVDKIQKGEVPEGYKETKVGIIPDDWAVKKLAEVSDIRTGPFGSALHQKDYVQEGTPIITVEHLGEQGVLHDNLPMVSDFDRNRLKSYILKRGDIVFSRVGSVDRNSLIRETENGWLFSGRLLRIRVTDANISPNYLSYYFHQEITKQRIRSVAVGQTMASLNTQILKEILVSFLPTRAEQEKIVEILSTWDKTIELKEKLIEEKMEFKRGLMQKLLTGKVRFPEFTDDWTEYQLKDICKFMKGSGLSKDKLSVNGDEKCILYGELYTTYSEVIQEVKSKTNIVEGVSSQKGDVLIPASTTTSGIDLANATALEEKSVLLGGDINILRNDKSLFNSSFLAYYLTHIKKFDLASKAQGITIVHLYGRHLKKIQVDLPQVKEQERIVQVLSIQDDVIEILTEKLLQLKEQKRGLMQLLLTGIVRVEVD